MSTSENLPLGTFLGKCHQSQESSGLVYSDMIPTVPPEDVQEHTHSDGHVVLLLAGNYRSSAHGVVGTINSPTLIWNPPGTHHRDRFDEPNGRFVTFSINADQWMMWREEIPSNYDFSQRMSKFSLPAAIRMWHRLKHWDADAAQANMADFMHLFSTADGLINTGARVADIRISRALQKMHDVTHQVLDIRALAKELDFHPVYFARLFRLQTGTSPAEYHRNWRLQCALQKLHLSRISIAELAADHGFVDQSHFHHAFKS